KLVEEYARFHESTARRLEEATTEEMRQRVIDTACAEVRKLAQHFLDLAQKNSGQPIALRSLEWVVLHRGGPEPTPEIEQALNVLARDHARAKDMGELCLGLATTEGNALEGFFKAVATQNS